MAGVARSKFWLERRTTFRNETVQLFAFFVQVHEECIHMCVHFSFMSRRALSASTVDEIPPSPTSTTASQKTGEQRVIRTSSACSTMFRRLQKAEARLEVARCRRMRGGGCMWVCRGGRVCCWGGLSPIHVPGADCANPDWASQPLTNHLYQGELQP